jgi:hypothetical protein
MTSCSKWKQLAMVTLFVFIHQLLAFLFVFWATRHLLFNSLSLKLWRPITTTFYVPCISMWKHVTSSLWMNASVFIFWLFYIHSPFRSTLLIVRCFLVPLMLIMLIHLLNWLIPSIYQLQISRPQILHLYFIIHLNMNHQFFTFVVVIQWFVLHLKFWSQYHFKSSILSFSLPLICGLCFT